VTGLGLDKTVGRGATASSYTVEARLGDGRKFAVLRGLHKPAAVRALDIMTSNFPRTSESDQ
jgi:hypothetical protein